jgi:hypothetical protein
MARLGAIRGRENCRADLGDEAHAKQGPVCIAAGFEQQAVYFSSRFSATNLQSNLNRPHDPFLPYWFCIGLIVRR